MLKLGKKINFVLIFWFFFYFLIFGILLKNSFSYLDPDLGWHIKVGEQIYRSGELPHHNAYNYTFTGDWVDHEWLINLVTFKIFNSLGYIALNIFFALVIILSLVLLNILIRKIFKKTSETLIALFQLFGVLASLPHFGIRMQEFSFLFFVLELYILEIYNKRKSAKNLLWLLPLFYLWASIHGSFLFGLGILFAGLIFKNLEKNLLKTKINKYFSDERLLNRKRLNVFLIFFLATTGVTLITPYGLDLYSFLSGYGNTFYLKAIQEWLPQSSFPFNYLQLSFLSFAGAIIIIFFYSSREESFKKIYLWHFFLLLVMLVLAFKFRRNFPLMFVVSFLTLPGILYSALNLEKIKSLNLNKLIKYFLLFAMFLTGLSNLLSFDSKVDPFLSFCSKYPCKAIQFLKNNSQYDSLNIFNEYNWGGYFIWTYPEKKLFIDGRLPQVFYKNHTFMEEYYEFIKKDSDFEKKLNEYDIRLAILKTKDDELKARKWEKSIFFIRDEDLKIPNNLRNYLESSSDWQKIYSDNTASIYVKVK